MANQHKQRSPTFWVSIIIVVAVGLVIATLLYNAISQKRAFDEAQSEAALPATAVAASGAAASAPASGAGTAGARATQ
jgi:hypothetical protein